MDLEIKIEDAWGGFWTRGSDGSAFFWDYDGYKLEREMNNCLAGSKLFHTSAAVQYTNEIKERFEDE